MFKSHYKIYVSGNNVLRFIKMLYKMDINFYSLNINDNSFTAIIDKDNYEKLKKIKTIYKINLERVYGPLYIKELIKKNSFFLFSIVVGLIILLFLTNIIFDIEVKHSDSNIRNFLISTLSDYGLKKYSFVKDYDEINVIKEDILNKYKNKIEWIEIERVGTKYIVRVDKRIINDIKEDKGFRNVVASRDGIIKKIVAKEGEITKKVNDYVKKGDIIISGAIHKGEDIKGNTKADGDIFAEVWYKVKVTLPINYYEKKLTGKEKNSIDITFLDKEYSLNKSFDNYEKEETILLSDFFNLFKIAFNKKKEIIIEDDINTITSEAIAINLAREKIIKRLGEDEYIISQKKLKTSINNSTIIIEVFFKVYENISTYNYYEIGG